MKIYVFCNQKDKSRAAYSEFIPLVKEFGYAFNIIIKYIAYESRTNKSI